jgi:charged multivesicular body protein 5
VGQKEKKRKRKRKRGMKGGNGSLHSSVFLHWALGIFHTWINTIDNNQQRISTRPKTNPSWHCSLLTSSIEVCNDNKRFACQTPSKHTHKLPTEDRPILVCFFLFTLSHSLCSILCFFFLVSMRRLFGSKKEKAPAPTLEDTSERMGKRTGAIDEKVKRLDKELHKIKTQMSKMREGPAKKRLKSRALALLRQKRMYETQGDRISQQQFNLEQVSFAQESMKDTVEQVHVMKGATKVLKQQYKQIKIEEIEKVQDEMEDLMYDHEEIQDVLSRSIGGEEDVSDDELLDELDSLAMEDDDASYLEEETDEKVGDTEESAAPEKTEEEDSDLQELESSMQQ